MNVIAKRDVVVERQEFQSRADADFVEKRYVAGDLQPLVVCGCAVDGFVKLHGGSTDLDVLGQHDDIRELDHVSGREQVSAEEDRVEILFAEIAIQIERAGSNDEVARIVASQEDASFAAGRYGCCVVECNAGDSLQVQDVTAGAVVQIDRSIERECDSLRVEGTNDPSGVNAGVHRDRAGQFNPHVAEAGGGVGVRAERVTHSGASQRDRAASG